MEIRSAILKSEFRFDKLTISGVDNSPIISRFGRVMSAQEITLFHNNIVSGDHYVELLHDRVSLAMDHRKALPVIRFADGEYAFYEGSLKCNGLYRQAESAEAINAVLPAHVQDLRCVADTGILAPLIFPGNFFRPKRRWRSFFGKASENDGARFLEFLSKSGVALTESNYVPFYAVYAYLTSARFARAVSGKKICILNSDIRREACVRWFGKFSSLPEIVAVPISPSLVATQWASMERDVLKRVPGDSSLCLVGAGIGALPVCASVSRSFSIPAIDAGHALNMMNDLETKSGGPRLYTFQS